MSIFAEFLYVFTDPVFVVVGVLITDSSSEMSDVMSHFTFCKDFVSPRAVFLRDLVHFYRYPCVGL